MSSFSVCRVHPSVLMAIADDHTRRAEKGKRVVGALLGSYGLDSVEVTNCFAVPHADLEDVVWLDVDYIRKMKALHKIVRPAEVVVGWYSSSSEISEWSSHIHHYFMQESKKPVHLTLDTACKKGNVDTKAYVSTPVGVPGKTVGLMFLPMPVEVSCPGLSGVGLDCVLQGKGAGATEFSLNVDPRERLTTNVDQMAGNLATITQYVDDVLAGKTPADPTVGRELMKMVSLVPRVDKQELESFMLDEKCEAVMIPYLLGLLQMNMNLHEKITSNPSQT